LGVELGSQATFVQFSATVCAPCRTTHRVLTDVVTDRPEIAHIDINAETRLDLVDEFGITRTPTVLILDGSGTVRRRIVGAARKPEVLDALDQVVGALAA
jgi:thiol-disulfide isomerase/thioredoxin